MTLSHVPETAPYAWPWDGTLTGERLALIVAGADVHWRARTVDRDAAANEIAALTTTVRATGGIVVHLHHDSHPSTPATGSAPPIPEPDLIVSCAGIDGFYGSPLDAILRSQGRSQLLLTGFGLEAPVHSTMRDANDQGYECLLVLDACAPLDADCRESAASMVLMSGGIFGAVGRTADVLTALDTPLTIPDPTTTETTAPRRIDMTDTISSDSLAPAEPAPPGFVAAEPYNWPYDGPIDVTKIALINIDWQTDFCGPGGYVEAMGYDLSLTRTPLAPTIEVIAACRAAGMFIIHTREGHKPDLSDCPPNKLWRSKKIGGGIGDSGPCGRMLIRGEPGWDIVPEVYPIEGEVIIDKPGKGSFYATDLDLILRTRGITHIILTGITTDVCVHTTMRDANDRGYECLLLSDCTGATDYGNYEAALKMVKMQGGVFGAVAPSSALHEALAAVGAASVA
jgi:nicotinamidase-related amidase